jgi:AsmA protein
MASWLLKLLIALGLLVAVTAAALTWLVATFDPNAYKGLAIDWMKDKHHRTLVIGGPITLSVFPRLEVTLSGVRVSEKDRPDTFAELDHLALAVRVLPLLSKRLEVDRVEARGLRATLTRDAAGRTNIDDLLEPPAHDPKDNTPSTSKRLQFDVSAVSLSELQLTVQDAISGVKGSVQLDRLKTGRLADGAESPVELDASVALQSPPVQGKLSGKTRLSLNLGAGAVTLRDTKLLLSGDLAPVRGLALGIEGRLAIDTTAGTALAEDLDLRVSGTVGTLALKDSRVMLKRFALDPAQRSLALSQLKVTLAGTQDSHPLGLSLDWPQLDVRGDKLSGSALSGQMSLEGPLALKADFKSAAPTGNFEQIKLPSLAATFKGRQGPRQLEGRVRTDVLVHVSVKSLRLDALSARLQVQEPSLQPLGIALNGHASASPTEAQWTLGGDINTNAFTTEGRLKLNSKPISLNLTAQFKSLDLNRLLPPPKTGAAAGTSAPSQGPAAALDLSPLRALQGRFSVKATQFAYLKYRVADATLEATLDGGVLQASRIAGKVWGGSVEGSASADAPRSRVAVKAVAQGVNVNALLKDVADKDVLEGTGRVAIDVHTGGRDVGEFKSRLDGTASLQLRDGAIKGANLAQTVREARSALAQRKDTQQAGVKTEQTDFSELSASFTVADGVARSNDLDVKSPFLRIGGDGSIDIARSSIDYTLRATVASTSKGQGGAELEALRGLTIPVRLTGPLDAVQWKIVWSALAVAALKSELGTQVQDKLKDKLRARLGLPPTSPAAPPADGAASSPPAPERSPRDQLKDRLRGLIK